MLEYTASMNMREMALFQKEIFFLIFTCYVYHLLFENEWDKHLNSSMMKGIHGIATCTSSALMFQKILLKFSSRFSNVNSIHRLFISDPRNEDPSLSQKPLFLSLYLPV